MRRDYKVFLLQFLAAAKGGRSFFVARATKGAKQLASVFGRMGLIFSVNETTRRRGFRGFIQSFDHKFTPQDRKFVFMRVELNKESVLTPAARNDYSVATALRSSCLPFSQIRWTRSTALYQKTTSISLKELRTRITRYRLSRRYILETPLGLLSSEEAVLFGVGGKILITIYL